MTIREKIEKMEQETLSPYATLSIHTRGREREEEQCDIRPVFQRDRDRIIHSKAFRRLKNKTQVFFAPEGDHYRTRLTHTLAVSQVARSIARALSLNQDLTEAIALGHDLGHTPFGHSGERILSRLNSKGFQHNVQSGRVADVLEKDGQGLNLTREVVDGMINHKMSLSPKTLEARAVSYADRIAYINHDIDDAIESGFITFDDLPKDAIELLGENSSKRINSLIYSIWKNSENKNQVEMGESERKAMEVLRAFLFERVYNDKRIYQEEQRADKMITALYDYYKKHVDKLPEFNKKLLDSCDIDTVRRTS